jgi:hypothetical protein
VTAHITVRRPFTGTFFEKFPALHVGKQALGGLMIKQIHSIEKSVLVDPDSVDAAALSEPAQEIKDAYLGGSEMRISLCHFGRDTCRDCNGDVVVGCQLRRSADKCRQCWIAPAGNPHSPVGTRNSLPLLGASRLDPPLWRLVGFHLGAAGLGRPAVVVIAFGHNRPFSQAKCKTSDRNANHTGGS